jgi:hypothetical protein
MIALLPPQVRYETNQSCPDRSPPSPGARGVPQRAPAGHARARRDLRALPRRAYAERQEAARGGGVPLVLHRPLLPLLRAEGRVRLKSSYAEQLTLELRNSEKQCLRE